MLMTVGTGETIEALCSSKMNRRLLVLEGFLLVE
jgi:hypothetical protein